jgi:TRAP-type transport system small permease protein
MLDILLVCLSKVNEVVSWVVRIALAILVIIILASIFYRYVLSDSLMWSGEVGRYLCIWIGFLSASAAIRERMHIGLEVVVQKAPPRFRWSMRLISDAAVMIFLVVVAVLGFKLALAQVKQTSPALMISMFWAYLSVPVSAVLMALQCVYLIINDLKVGPNRPDA